MVLHQLIHIALINTEWKPKMLKSRHPKVKNCQISLPKRISKWKILNPIKAYHDPHHLNSGVYPLGWGICILINWSWRVKKVRSPTLIVCPWLALICSLFVAGSSLNVKRFLSLSATTLLISPSEYRWNCLSFKRPSTKTKPSK